MGIDGFIKSIIHGKEKARTFANKNITWRVTVYACMNALANR